MARVHPAGLLLFSLAGCGLALDLAPPEGPRPRLDAAVTDATSPRDTAPPVDSPADAVVPTDGETCTPLPEECNGLDDNCDGLIDEIFDFENDPTRCGGCTTLCAAATHGTPVCVAGICGILCEPGWEDCDGAPGCETDLGSQDDCGACGNTCPPGARRCSHVGATYACTADCPSGAPNLCAGSCVDLETDPRHCGDCGASCAIPNATVLCVGGSCEIGACAPGWGDCDGSVTNGCETRLNTNADCGACGNACGSAASCGRGGVCVGVTETCDSWATSWICAENAAGPGSCRSTCGTYVVACSSTGSCSCAGTVCPSSGAFGCEACQRALDSGCCGF